MARHWKVRNPDTRLDPVCSYYVVVCGFTFQFHSLLQLRETLEFYRRPIHPSSRLPDKHWVEAEARSDPARHRSRIARFIRAEHDVIQRWWERLPLYLQEAAKRPRVVRALEQALAKFTSAGEFRNFIALGRVDSPGADSRSGFSTHPRRAEGPMP